MSKELSVVCPQCKEGLTIDYENRNMAIACPDCQKLFRIGNVVETVVGAKATTASKLDSDIEDMSDSSSQYSRITGEKSTKRAWESMSNRSLDYSNRTKQLEKSSTEEMLQAVGYFMLAVAILGCLLPAFGFEFGRIALPPRASTIFCGVLGAIGAGMILAGNFRHRFAVAFGWCTAFVVLGLGAWALCYELSEYNSPFRWAAAEDSFENESGSAPVSESVANAPASSQGIGALAPTTIATKRPVTNKSNDNFTNASNEPPLSSTPIQIKEFTTLAPNRGDSDYEKELDKLRRNFLSDGVIRDGTKGEPIEFRQDLELRFQRLNQTPVLGGVAQSEEFNSKYKLSNVIGRQTKFGDALYNGQPVKGLDVAMGQRTSGIQFILPIYDKALNSNSLLEEGHYLGGVNLYVLEERVVGVQAILCEGSANTGVVDESKKLRSFWRGAGIREPATVSSKGRKIYGLVTYSERGRIVGIQLILKR